jgi:hypothetical protein
MLSSKLSRCTKPGGYFEQLEISIMFKSEDGSITEDHFMAQWSKTLLYAAEQVGKTFAIYDFNRDLITQAGFVDVVEKKYKVPVGTWSSDPKMKELGQWNMLFCLQGLESWSLYLLSKVLNVRPPSLCYDLLKRVSLILQVGICENTASHCANEEGNPFAEKSCVLQYVCCSRPELSLHITRLQDS